MATVGVGLEIGRAIGLPNARCAGRNVHRDLLTAWTGRNTELAGVDANVGDAENARGTSARRVERNTLPDQRVRTSLASLEGVAAVGRRPARGPAASGSRSSEPAWPGGRCRHRRRAASRKCDRKRRSPAARSTES